MRNEYPKVSPIRFIRNDIISPFRGLLYIPYQTKINHDWMSPENIVMRQNSHLYLRTLLEEGVIPNLAYNKSIQIELIDIGDLSTNYLIRTDQENYVVKFRPTPSSDIEAETLRDWEGIGVKVPKVISSSHSFPLQSPTGDRINYTVTEAVIDEKNELAPTGEFFLLSHPEKSGELGQLMGVELAKIHSFSVGELLFGSLVRENTHMYPARYFSWNAHLIDMISIYRETILKHFEVTENDVDILIGILAKMQFPTKGVLAHGDYHLTNVLIKKAEPLEIAIIDPNPIIADPYWDIAKQTNRVFLRRYRVKMDSESVEKNTNLKIQESFYTSFLKSYQEITGEPIDEQRLLANQIPLTIYKYLNQTAKSHFDLAEEARQLGRDQIRTFIQLYKVD